MAKKDDSGQSGQFCCFGGKSAGFGVRVITPMGVLRFEYGSKLDKRPSETPDRFEFTVSGLF